MHGQTEQLKPLGQLHHESLCIVLVLKTGTIASAYLNEAEE